PQMGKEVSFDEGEPNADGPVPVSEQGGAPFGSEARAMEDAMRLPRERFDYSAIVDREPLKLPDGARIAVWTIVNVEEWNIEAPMPRTVLTTPAGVSVIPDVPNWSWHEYGMRFGFW